MANQKISAMPLVGAAIGTDYFPCIQGGVNSRETITQVFALLQTTAGLVFTNSVQFSGGIVGGAAGGTSHINPDGSADFSSTISALSGINTVITLEPATAQITLGDGATISGVLLIKNSNSTTSGSLASNAVENGIKIPVGSLEIAATAAGIVLTAPNASRWRFTVDNSGQLSSNPA